MKKLSQRIIAFNQHRLPDMVQLKYKAMVENPFRFYRGTAHLFYEDLKAAPNLPASPLAWICGDLHLENFGSFKSDNRLVYFDLNDFDEAVLAPAAYELVRTAASIFIGFDTLQVEQEKAMHMAGLFLKSYCDTLSFGKPDYIEPHTAQGIIRDFLTAVSKRTSKDILNKKTLIRKGKEQLALGIPRHFKLDKGLKKELSAHIKQWLKTDGDSPYNYEPVDAVFRLAGTGSVGLKRYAILLRTLNETGECHLLIDMKQSTPSSLNPYIDTPQPKWASEAERIISIQHRMQNRPPALLSTTQFKGEPYVIQEMQPTKDSIDFKLLRKDYRNMCRVITDMGVLTASAQLRSSGRQGSAIADELIAFGKKSNWQEALIAYAVRYAKQVKKDYAQFVSDHKAGVFKPKQQRA